MTEEQFIAAVTEGQSVAPLYFAFAADANRRERELLDDQQPPAALTIDELRALGDEVVVIDTRSSESFASGHLRGSINVGLDGRFAEYAGNVLRPGQRVVIVGAAGRATEAKVRLARIGFDDVVGAVDNVELALLEHPGLAESAKRLPASDVRDWLAEDDNLQVVDVRNAGETSVGGTVPGAQIVPLPQLLAHLDKLDPARPTVVYCAGGYRSAVAASVLRAHGFTAVADMIGGYDAWLANPTSPTQAATHV